MTQDLLLPKYETVFNGDTTDINWKEQDLVTKCCGCGMVHQQKFHVDGDKLSIQTWEESKANGLLSKKPPKLIRTVPPPVETQTHFRGRAEIQTNALIPTGEISNGLDWLAALDTNWTQYTEEPFRIRFEISNAVATFNGSFSITASLNSGLYLACDNSINSIVQCINSKQYANGTNTTQQIGSGTYVSTNGGMVGANLTTASMTMSATTVVEVEFCLVINTRRVKAGDRIQFHVVRTGGIDISSYNQVPNLTVAIKRRPGAGAHFGGRR